MQSPELSTSTKGSNMLSTRNEMTDSPESSKVASSRQNLPTGILAGVGAMLAGTVLWILVAQKYQVSWMSIVVAFGIASATKYAGKVTVWWPGAINAILALIAAIIGNLATAVYIVSKRGKTPGEIMAGMDVGTAVTFLKALSGPVGIVFYALAIYVGFWFSFTHIPKTPGELPD